LAETTAFFQWQNPHLCTAIYPFREKKLRDFLLYYREIDLYRKMSAAAVDPGIAAELLQQLSKLETELSLAKLRKDETEAGIKALRQKHRQVLSSPKVRSLAQQKVNLGLKLESAKPTIRRLERQIQWYQEFAPQHPFFEKYKADLAAVKAPYEAAQAELARVQNEYDAELSPFETEARSLQNRLEELKTKIKSLTDELRRFPKLEPGGTVKPGVAVRWLLLKYENELNALDQYDLLEKILERFAAEPARFPRWLQYMVVHFSGMRYKSAHGSWSDPRALLEAIQTEEVRNRIQKAPPAELERAAVQSANELQAKKRTLTNPSDIRQLDLQAAALANPINRQSALLKQQTAMVTERVKQLSHQQVLAELKARKDTLPKWAWKEIVSRTELRNEFAEKNWEELNPQERQERWQVENEHWRQIMDFWERRDVTEWRKQHELTLSLVVTRAVCNEIAEHIQHLRGVKPGAGLTAKPPFYIRSQKSSPGNAYFRRPTSAADFKAGASILWLGWVDRQPNPWQIARPLDGYELAPTTARPTEIKKRHASETSEPQWRYSSGSEFVRSAQIQVPRALPGGGGKTKLMSQPVQQWLRWTHEATVISVERMADGRDYVLTFETGQIGVILRPLSSLINTWDVFVGFVPPGAAEPTNLDTMLERSKILPPRPPVVKPGVSFDIPPAEEEISPEDVERLQAQRRLRLELVQRWQALTPRQRQVVALLCQGLSTREIATRLDTSTSTIRSHLSAARHKFDLHSREVLCQALSVTSLGLWQED
jgi:DNA-binding CsgD family transcriptional regulator